jgi:hypothetical protein
MEVDQMFSAAALSDSSYSTVPWFQWDSIRHYISIYMYLPEQ